MNGSSDTLVSLTTWVVLVVIVDDAVGMFVIGFRVASGVEAAVLLGALTGRLAVEVVSIVGRRVGGIL